MKEFIPGYCDQFRCIAAQCPDSCCKEWAVDVDAATAAYYRALPGALGDRLREVLNDDNTMTIVDGRCPMWRADSLCRVHAELGHDALCDICREYPRIRHEYDEFTELGLELSCPEAARLILTTDWDMPTCEDAQDPDLQILLESRRNALSILDAYPLPQALAVILVYGHHVQTVLDGGEIKEFAPDNYLQTAEKLPKAPDWDALFRFFGGLEILTEEWKGCLEGSPRAIAWSPVLKALMRYMILRYWLQAVSDLDLVCRVKFGVAACLVVGAIGNDPIATAQLFSKEIENDPDNVKSILDGAYSAPALTDQNLLSLLLA